MDTSKGRIRSVVETEIYRAKLKTLVEGQEWAAMAFENLYRVLASDLAEAGWAVRGRQGCHSWPVRVGPDRDLRVVYLIERSRVVLIDVWQIPQPGLGDFQ